MQLIEYQTEVWLIIEYILKLENFKMYINDARFDIWNQEMPRSQGMNIKYSHPHLTTGDSEIK